ncbi:MAG: hypothetical protein V7L11_25395 [Nostoc sp.]|uniref:hypothetical protein n=1 Tax=Nostoc sp. TaxID=1180 RepID=UPI002FFD1DD9
MPTQNTSITEVDGSQPLLHQHGYEIQQYGTLRDLPVSGRTFGGYTIGTQLN